MNTRLISEYLSGDFCLYDQEQIYDDFIVIIIEWSQKHLTFLKEELKFTFFFLADFKFTHIKENMYGENPLKSQEKEVRERK